MRLFAGLAEIKQKTPENSMKYRKRLQMVTMEITELVWATEAKW